MIQTINIRKVYNQGRANEFCAVDCVDLTVNLGGIYVLKGPSGSGKTSLLSILGCMARPSSGRIYLSGREITSLPERFLTDIRRRTFGFIFQNLNLIKGISVLENVMLPAYPFGERRQTLMGRAQDLLERFELGTKALSRIEWLSGGEAQRVAIARALINNPRILIADEPTAHLDTALSEEFMAIMTRLNQGGTSVIIASHDPIVYDSTTITGLIELRDGRIVQPAA
ncbi:MAG: ABC transporter ATP-binding protein [Desulfuromonadaceae bacterium]|nr:ABC transporter ATP-binding protein [Desulfuromonadaceae bacterium]